MFHLALNTSVFSLTLFLSTSSYLFDQMQQKLRTLRSKLPLKALLVQPVQRIPRYELLVKVSFAAETFYWRLRYENFYLQRSAPPSPPQVRKYIYPGHLGLAERN